MSRFWGGGSDSESEEEVFSKSEEEEEEQSEEEEEQEGGGFFDRMDSDGDEPEVKRVVRSQKDKRNEAINAAIKSIKNALKINDWVATQDEFDNLLKVVQKATSGADKVKTPRAFIRCMVSIEDTLEGAWSTKDKKKMSANNQKSMSSMKQRLRKEKQKFEKEMELFRQSPVDTDQSEEERAKGQDEEEGEEEKEAEPELTAEDIDRVIQEVISSRGKKNINRKKQFDTLRTLLELSEQAIDEVKILLAIVTLRLDQVIGMGSHMPTVSWRHAQGEVNQILDILEKNEELLVTTEVEDTADENSESYQKVAKRGKKPISGSLVAILERLDDEFTKSLQNIDSHTTEYIERLRDANDLYHLIVRIQGYYEKSKEQGEASNLCRIMIRRVEHIYYKSDSINNAMEKKVQEKIRGAPSEEEVDSSSLMQRLTSFLFKHGDERIKTRALLCEVYHHALHGRYFKARDLLLMSHLQEFIQNAEVPTKILFNRAMVQTGLCAFRHGMLKESQAALQDINSTGRSKELLAQGVIIQKGIEKTSEQEKLEKQRQVPFHMHINLELLECIFLTCSMILEVPFMAASSYEARKRIVSKALRRVLDQSERQIFSGPPENTREHIMHATKALMGGDWERCIKLIHAIKIWDLMPEVEKIKQMLSTKIQQAGIQTYLLSYGNFYETISLEQLSKMFKLKLSEVHAIVSRMIVNDELHASLDQVTGVAVIHRVEPTKLQYLSLQYTEKVQGLIETNEKILEIRTGNLGSRDDNKPGQQQGQNPNKYGSKPPGKYQAYNRQAYNPNKRQNYSQFRGNNPQFRPRYQPDDNKAE